ncbi:MAG: nitronate monooxygenase [Thermoleophilia bacterium]|nr:nitronate monooxygenase [Thermoleophilia bacterium]
MAGGITPPVLVAAVSAAGGFGTVGAGTLSPDRLREVVAEIRARTDRPFGVNLLFPPARAHAAAAADAVNAVLAPFRADAGVVAPPRPHPMPPGLVEAQLQVAIDERVSMVTFAFGLPPAGAIEALHAVGAVVFGTANTVDEARAVAAAGADAVVAQGSEAGGHRAGLDSEALVGLVALVPAVVDAVDVPVVAAGGIMDGRGIAAALMLGAEGVQLGTAFLLAHESTAPEAYKAALAAAREDASVTTRAFTGRRARALPTPMIEALEAAGADLLPYPQQASLTAPIRERGIEADRAEWLLLLGGQGTRLARRLPVAELVAALDAETRATLARVG